VGDYGHDITLRDRLYARLEPDPCGCLLWTRARDAKGYGRIAVRGQDGKIRSGYVHIAAWVLEKGPVPAGFELDHVKARGCLHRHCANVAHMEVLTHKENLMRGGGVGAVNAAKECCPADHPYDEANTYIDKRGCRICRACRRDRQRQWRAEHPGYFRPYDRKRGPRRKKVQPVN
jgi:hypothetical protein